MFNGNKNLLMYLCFPMLFLFGCSSSFDKRINKEHSANSRLLEERIDELSGKINLIIHDTNVLHNEMEEAKTPNKTAQQKIEELEATVRNLNEQVSSLNAPAKTSDFVRPPAEETDVKQPVPSTDSNKPADKVDADQTIIPVSGESMGEMTQGPGKTTEEVPDKGAEEMGKSIAEDMQKGLQEMTQTGEAQPDIMPQKQEAAIISEVTEQNKDQGIQKSTEDIMQASEAEPDITPQKQETAATNEVSEPTKREAFLKDNIVRLAETEFPDNKGIQWNILSFEHKAHLTHVEVEPTPATVGYPRFKFAVSFKNPETPRVIGTYCFKDGQYSLLSTRKN